MESANNVAASYMANHVRRDFHSPMPMPGHGDANALTSQFMGLSLGAMNGNPAPVQVGPSHGYMLGADGQIMLAPMTAHQSVGVGHSVDNVYPNIGMPPGVYNTPYPAVPMPFMPFTPGRLPMTQARPDRNHSEVPGLENRRGSYSTTESAPGTPFYSGVAHRDHGPRVAGVDRSTYTTPSPQALAMANIHVDPPVKPSAPTMSDRSLEELLKNEPAIPKAVPAVFTPPGQMKSLEQSLENRISGNRNVYIRGLHPTTDDELLLNYTARFGAVETSKAIIDTGTGACKG